MVTFIVDLLALAAVVFTIVVTATSPKGTKFSKFEVVFAYTLAALWVLVAVLNDWPVAS